MQVPKIKPEFQKWQFKRAVFGVIQDWCLFIFYGPHFTVDIKPQKENRFLVLFFPS